MDKFGIFKLLNSFLSQNGQNNTSQTENPLGAQNNENPLATLLNSLTKGTKSSADNISPPAPKTQNDNKTFAPLQSAMLSTMNSHDQFVKRVKEKNKTH